MSLSNVQVTVMTALVSFDRVFEVLDLKPLIDERPVPCRCRPASAPVDGSAPEIEFDDVSFRYPKASEVSLASLESIAITGTERADGGQLVLHHVSFRAAAASSPRWSARPVRARPRSRTWSPGSMTSAPARSGSAGTMSAT